MKKILLLLLFSMSCWSQTHNFEARNKELVWENVIVSNATGIPELLSKHTRLTITSSNNPLYKGKGSQLKNNCPGTAAFMESEFSFDFEIEVSAGKYRVTVSNLMYHPAKESTVTAGKYFLEKGTLKQDAATKAGLNCIDAYLNRIFTNMQVYKNKM